MKKLIIITAGVIVVALIIVLGLSCFNKELVSDVTEINSPHAFSCIYKGEEHKFNIYLPEDYDESKSYPLVIMLHGFGNNAESFSSQTHFHDAANKEGYVVVYLTSIPDSKGDVGWNSGLGDSDKDDVGYIKAITATIWKKYNCDKKHTYAVGFSNGAFMTQRLAVDAADTFTAVVSVAGMMPKNTWDSRKEKTNVGVLEIYGTKDDVVPMKSNGSDKTAVAPAIEDVMAYWVNANGLSEKEELILSEKANCEKYTNEKQSQFVWTVVINDGRHSWPDKGFCGFDVNELILDYFTSYAGDK